GGNHAAGDDDALVGRVGSLGLGRGRWSGVLGSVELTRLFGLFQEEIVRLGNRPRVSDFTLGGDALSAHVLLAVAVEVGGADFAGAARGRNTDQDAVVVARTAAADARPSGRIGFEPG